MKVFYHSLIMWIPFVLLFSFAIYGVELLEGDKIRTTEHLGFNDLGPLFPLLIGTSIGAVLYPVSFLPLTFMVSKYVQKPKFKMFILTFFGGLIGAFVFKLIYESRLIEEYNLSKGYKLIEVDGGDLSGHREPNVVVDIGFGDRHYYAFTNEAGQLVRVIADQIVLQDDRTEPVTSSGRYYADEAKVPGVERADLDEGHIIEDSLGGVSNSYNITPQDSTLNRHGDQAYMEDAIRKAGGATNFEAIITYPNTETQIPSHYKYTYTLKGNKIVDEFGNGNPDEINKSLGLTESKSTILNKSTSSNKSNASNGTEDISSVDTDGNGQVTIKEAKVAGYSMPITREHWLYKYMQDRDNDGMVGE